MGNLKILYCCSSISSDHAIRLNRIFSNSKHSVTVVCRISKLNFYKKYFTSIDTLPTDDPKQKLVLHPTVDEQYVFDEIVNDHQTFMLFDRQAGFFTTSSHKIRALIKLISISITYLKSTNPNVIVSNATPHDINMWIFLRTAELIGIEVLFFAKTALPWRAALLKGITANPSIVSLGGTTISTEKDIFRKMIVLKRGTANEAMPDYEKKRLEKNSGKEYSWLLELSRLFSKPLDTIYKSYCYFIYRRLAVNADTSGKFFVFFLQYQPEQTTLPEGFGFAQQVRALRLLASVAPDDVSIFVKEHPSTFTRFCSWRERSPDFYRDIANIPNVTLVNSDIDAYALIDSALLTVTITGTVAFEALIRGKCALTFGRSPLLGYDGANFHQYSNPKDLSHFIAYVVDKRARTNGNDQDIERYFNRMTQCTSHGFNDREQLAGSKSQKELYSAAIYEGIVDYIEKKNENF